MKQKTTEKCVGSIWEETEGLQAFEEITYVIEMEQNKRQETPALLLKSQKVKSRLWGFRDERGNVIIPPIYDFVWKFYGGLAKVCLNGKWGLIDRLGNVIIPAIYQKIHMTSDGLVQIQSNKSLWGCLRKDGSMIVEPRYDYIFPFRFGFAGIKKEGKYGFVNLADQEVITPCFDEIGQITPEGTVKVRNGHQWKTIALN